MGEVCQGEDEHFSEIFSLGKLHTCGHGQIVGDGVNLLVGLTEAAPVNWSAPYSLSPNARTFMACKIIIVSHVSSVLVCFSEYDISIRGVIQMSWVASLIYARSHSGAWKI